MEIHIYLVKTKLIYYKQKLLYIMEILQQFKIYTLMVMDKILTILIFRKIIKYMCITHYLRIIKEIKLFVI